MTPVSEPPRVVIEDVTPVVDGGRYPVKLPWGSTLEVSASEFRDGHNLVAAVSLRARGNESPAKTQSAATPP